MAEGKAFRVIRPDGIRSKPLSRAAIVDLFNQGKLADDWKIAASEGDSILTLAEFIGQSELLQQWSDMSNGSERAASRGSKQLNSDSPSKSHRSKKRKRTEKKPVPEPQTKPLIRIDTPDRQSGQNTQPVDCSEFEIGSSGYIRVSLLKEFISDLPNRSVAVKYSDQLNISQVDLENIRQSLNGLPDDNPVTIPERRLALILARKKNGWLGLEFSSRYPVAIAMLWEHADLIIDPRILLEMFSLSNTFLARNEAGMMLSDATDLLAKFIELENKSILLCDRSSWSEVFVRDPIDDLRQAVNVWRSSPMQINGRLTPVAFPRFRDTFSSIATAAAVNSAVSWFNSILHNRYQQSLMNQVSVVVQKLVLAQLLSAQRLRNLDAPLS